MEQGLMSTPLRLYGGSFILTTTLLLLTLLLSLLLITTTTTTTKWNFKTVINGTDEIHASQHVPGEITISFQGREQRTFNSIGWTRRAIDQTRSVESREHETTVNGLSTWQARPTAANQQKQQTDTSFLQGYIIIIIIIIIYSCLLYTSDAADE